MMRMRPMHSLLVAFGGEIPVLLQTNAAEIARYWERLLEGWLRPVEGVDEPQIFLMFELVDQLPDLPAAEPIFIDEHAFL